MVHEGKEIRVELEFPMELEISVRQHATGDKGRPASLKAEEDEKPPISSIMPPNQLWDPTVGCLSEKTPNNFCIPCIVSMNPDMIRNNE